MSTTGAENGALPVLRNALWSGSGRLVTLSVGVAVTPYLFARLGAERFGAWALLSGVAGLAGLLDFSFKSSFVRHLAEADARRDDTRLRAILSTALAVYAAFAAVALPLAWVVPRTLVALLGLPPSLQDEATRTLALLLTGSVAGGALSIFAALCDARQRMDLTNALGCATLAAGTLLTVAAVETGGGLPGVAAAQLAATVLFHLACIPAARRLVGPFDLRLSRIDAQVFRELFRFGIRLHVSAACWTLNRQIDKLLLARAASLPFVASYELGMRVVGNAGTLQPFLAAGLLPAASRLAALGERAALAALYVRASRYLFLAGLPPFLFAAANADALMAAWIGHPDPVAATAVRILAAGYAANALSHALAYVTQGVGRADLQAEQSLVQLGLNLVASLTLLRAVGPLGTLVGTSAALTAGAAWLVWRVHPGLGVPTGRWLRDVAVLPLGLATAAALAGRLAVASFPAPHDRISALTNLAVGASAFALAWFAGIGLSGLVRHGEIAQLRAALRPVPEATP